MLRGNINNTELGDRLKNRSLLNSTNSHHVSTHRLKIVKKCHWKILK